MATRVNNPLDELENDIVQAMHQAAERGDWDTVRYLMNTPEGSEEIEIAGARDVLDAAIVQNQPDIVHDLLQYETVIMDAVDEQNHALRLVMEQLHQLDGGPRRNMEIIRDRLLSIPAIFRGAERNEGGREHGVWGSALVHEFIVRILDRMQWAREQFVQRNPNAQFDLREEGAPLYFYILRNMIRNTDNDPRFTHEMQNLLNLPTLQRFIAAVVHGERADITDEEEDILNELTEANQDVIPELQEDQLLELAIARNNQAAVAALQNLVPGNNANMDFEDEERRGFQP